MTTLRGIAVSPGYAEGTILVYRPPMLDGVEHYSISEKEKGDESKRFSEALDHAIEEIVVVRQQVAADIGDSEAAIFDAHEAMLRDEALIRNVQDRIERQLICAEAALADELTAFADKLASCGNDYMQELAMDVHDVGNRVLRHLSMNECAHQLSDIPPGSIIVATDLMPSETVCLDRNHVIGIASERGGPTSHAAILARSLGIPAATGFNGLMNTAANGEPCLLDGARGTLALNPSDSQIKRFNTYRREFDRSRELMKTMEKQVCCLKNGTRIKLMANINQAGDIDLAAEHNLDGIGLYRTELMYLSSHAAPTPVTQTRHYSRAAAACGKAPVTIRTFDFAADKHPGFLSIDTAHALDLRGLRFALNQPRLFKSQLRSIVRSAKDHPNIRILFPMVTGWWELKEALEMIRTVSEEEELKEAISVGAMIETPAAIFALPEIIHLVDFISIGCNDLAQYILAMERNNSTKTISASALHPSLLRAIKQITETAEEAACPVSICGEAASDPIMAAVFCGLGIRELSISPARAPVIHYALRHITLSEAKRAAECAIQADPSRILHDLESILPSDLKPVLAMESGNRNRKTSANETPETPTHTS